MYCNLVIWLLLKLMGYDLLFLIFILKEIKYFVVVFDSRVRVSILIIFLKIKDIINCQLCRYLTFELTKRCIRKKRLKLSQLFSWILIISSHSYNVPGNSFHSMHYHINHHQSNETRSANIDRYFAARFTRHIVRHSCQSIIPNS